MAGEVGLLLPEPHGRGHGGLVVEEAAALVIRAGECWLQQCGLLEGFAENLQEATRHEDMVMNVFGANAPLHPRAPISKCCSLLWTPALR